MVGCRGGSPVTQRFDFRGSVACEVWWEDGIRVWGCDAGVDAEFSLEKLVGDFVRRAFCVGVAGLLDCLLLGSLEIVA